MKQSMKRVGADSNALLYNLKFSLQTDINDCFLPAPTLSLLTICKVSDPLKEVSVSRTCEILGDL